MSYLNSQAKPSPELNALPSPSPEVLRALGSLSGSLRPILESHAAHYWKIRNDMLGDMKVGGSMRNELVARQYAALARQLDAEMERFARVVASHYMDGLQERYAG